MRVCEIYMRMRRILRMTTHEPFPCSNTNYSTQNQGQNSKISFQLDDLDLWPMTLTIKLAREVIKVHLCTKFGDHTSNTSAVRAHTAGHTPTPTHTPTQPAPSLQPRPLTQEVITGDLGGGRKNDTRPSKTGTPFPPKWTIQKSSMMGLISFGSSYLFRQTNCTISHCMTCG